MTVYTTIKWTDFTRVSISMATWLEVESARVAVTTPRASTVSAASLASTAHTVCPWTPPTPANRVAAILSSPLESARPAAAAASARRNSRVPTARSAPTATMIGQPVSHVTVTTTVPRVGSARSEEDSVHAKSTMKAWTAIAVPTATSTSHSVLVSKAYSQLHKFAIPKSEVN